MFPMTPLQSWAFVALLFITVIAVVHLIIEIERAAAARRQASVVDEDLDAHEPEDEHGEPRPQLVLITSEPDHEPTQVYDWAMQGI